MEQKHKSLPLDANKKNGANLGLDADHSSEENSIFSRLDDDNDRISGNPDGEKDESKTDKEGFYAPLDDK
jgi:hypothetical protein